jgi:hypothetical protein
LSAWVNFSVLPLRIATILGLALSLAGVVALVSVGALWVRGVGPEHPFGWIMAGLLTFSGAQLALLGVLGEYIGRMFLTINQRPQAIVRSHLHSDDFVSAFAPADDGDTSHRAMAQHRGLTSLIWTLPPRLVQCPRDRHFG